MTDKQIVTSDAGLLFIDVVYSNIHDYDIRKKSDYYYCVIHHGKAELVEGGLTLVNIGDSITVNFKTRSFEQFRGGKFIRQKPLHLRKFGAVVQGVKKLHWL